MAEIISDSTVRMAMTYSDWHKPPPQGSFRLGEHLWSGRAELKDVPACTFFPRRWYGAVHLPGYGGSSSLLLLGGSNDNSHSNDVWELTIPSLGASKYLTNSRQAVPRWTSKSPPNDGEINSQGLRVLRKWRGRHDFGCCAAPAKSGGLLVYVVAGERLGSPLSDVWASETRGSTWACMSSSAPWGKRKAPALCAVPGHPDVLVLAGGFGPCADVKGDVWISDDSGSTWAFLERPPWSLTTGRYRAALLPLPHRCDDDSGAASMLLIGGCFIDGQDGGGGGGTIGLERLMHDAWECKLDLLPTSGVQGMSWVEWGIDSEQRGSLNARRGVEYATCTIDTTRRTLIARLPNRNFVSVAEARPPDAASIGWHQADLQEHSDVAKPRGRTTDALSAGDDLTYIRFVDAGCETVPRLALMNTRGVWLTTDHEWRRHFRFALLLGLRFENMFGIPRELWLGRVLPSLLPAVQTPVKSTELRSPLARDLASPRPRHSASELADSSGYLWEVISGMSRGGIIVRVGREISSERMDQRLSQGAVVRQEELVGERLRFTKLEGAGPVSGWVSVRLQDRDLVRRFC